MMETSLITQRLLAKLSRSIGEVTSLPISFEVQEGGQFLLISIAGHVEEDVGERIASIVEHAVPRRSDDDSWMVVIMDDDEVVDSYSGGNISAFA